MVELGAKDRLGLQAPTVAVEAALLWVYQPLRERS